MSRPSSHYPISVSSWTLLLRVWKLLLTPHWPNRAAQLPVGEGSDVVPVEVARLVVVAVVALVVVVVPLVVVVEAVVVGLEPDAANADCKIGM